MARTKRSALIEFWSQRQKLEPGRDHTETLATGRYLLYWRPLNGAAGSWRARFYDPGTKKMTRHPLGVADDFLAADGVKILTCAQATTKAEKWFKDQERRAILTAGGEAPPEGPYTVADAMRDYLADLRRRGKNSAGITETTINAHILPPLGALDVAALTKGRLQKWHQDLAETGRRRTGRVRETPDHLPAPATPEEQRQRKDTANRILTTLKAGLNLALKNGRVEGPAPWREVMPFKDVSSSRVRFLVDDEPRLLVEACDGEFRALVIGALSSGARYGELGRCVVRDFSATSRTLFIEFGKNGRSRHIHLDAEAVVWFSDLVKGREGDETLFRHTGVVRAKRVASDDWMPYDQRDRMERAYKAAGIPKVTFHELRHTYASHLILKGMPLLYVAAQLGHRDTRMVERHYGHLVPSAVAKAVKKHAPKMGIYGVKK